MIHSRGRSFTGRIDISALIDVSLVLLIVLMTQSYLVGHPVTLAMSAEECEPPTCSEPGCGMVLGLDRFGRALIGKEQIRLSDFGFRLRQTLQGRVEKPVLFSASRNLPYGQVLDFMDLCQRNGARNLALVLDDMFEDQDL